MQQKTAGLLVLVASLLSTPVVADCGDDSNNLTQSQNCDMDSNPSSPFTIIQGVLTHDMTDGYPAAATPGSAELDAVDPGSGFPVTSMQYNCVVEPVSATTVTAGYWVRQASGITAPSCSVTAQFYPTVSGTSCTGLPVATCTDMVVASGTWSLVECEATLPAAAAGFRLTAVCQENSMADDFVVRKDNFFVIEAAGQMPVELQSFSIE